MKTMKKLASLLLALAMIFGLATTAFGTEVTINSSNNTNATYKAYKLMNATATLLCTTEHNHSDKDCYGFLYTLNDTYKTVLMEVANVTEAAAGKTIDQTVVDVFATMDGKDLAQKIYDKVKNMNADETLSAGTTATLAEAYWLIVDSSTLANEEVRSQVMIDTAGKEVLTITAKDSKVTIDKKVNGKDTYVTADIDEEVTFTLTSNLPTYLDNYTTYTFKFIDTMESTLDFVELKSVVVDDTTLVNTQYTLGGFFADPTKTNGEGTIDLSDYVTANKAALSGATVTVTYTAKLNSTATVAEPENNKVKVEYTNDYTTSGEGETAEDDVDVYTYKINIVKYTDNNGTDDYQETDTRLSGAEFQLSKVVDDVTYYATASGDASPYTLTGWTATVGEAKTFVTNANGEIEINGLNVGAYSLTETKAPAGYNLLTAPVAVEVKDTAAENAEVPTLASETAYVENNAGTELPSTGGMGTTLFYVVGGILVAAAAVLLVTKKRMAN